MRGCRENTNVFPAERACTVRSLLAQAAQARTEAVRQRLETQIGAAALLVMLVNVDAEHRLIPPALAERLLGLLQKATAADAPETTSREAAEVLTRVFDPAIHPLVASALGSTDALDTSFLAGCGAGTG